MGDDPQERVGMALHLAMSSINYAVQRFNVDHVVIALEGRSWRKDFYAPYKKNRNHGTEGLTEEEIEEKQLYRDAYDDLVSYFKDKTNVSVLRAPQGEADDIIARFIHLHPNDKIIIDSTDSDYDQLISDRVHRYDGVQDRLIKLDGYFDSKDKPIIDNKTGTYKVFADPKYILFEKTIRGDSSDNVFSAYPGVRAKGTKNKVGIIQAFDDMTNKGFNWNNFMNQTWLDHEQVQHKVKDDYERNVKLIDLDAQPQDIKDHVDSSISENIVKPVVSQTGIHFMRFCNKYDLVRLMEKSSTFIKWLNAPYTGELNGTTNDSKADN